MFKFLRNNNHKAKESQVEAENETLKGLILEQDMRYFEDIHATNPDGYVIVRSHYIPSLGDVSDALTYCYLNKFTKEIEKISLTDETYPVRINTKEFLGNQIAEIQVTKENSIIKILINVAQSGKYIDAKVNYPKKALYYVSEIDKKAITGGFIMEN